MEHNTEFQNIINFIKSLERRAIICQENVKFIEKNREEAEKKIEEHFAKCIHALAARKEILLRECAVAVNNARTKNEDTLKQIKDSIAGCNKALEAGTFFYATNEKNAEKMWQVTVNLPVPDISKPRVITTLPLSLVDTIQNHGTAKLQLCTFSRVDTVTTLAGSTQGFSDGSGADAKFSLPRGILFSPHSDCLFVCDYGNSAIRTVTKTGDVRTFVSVTDLYPYYISLNFKSHELFCTHTTSKVSYISSSGDYVVKTMQGTEIRGIAIDQTTGTLFVADTTNNRICTITPQGNMSTLVASGGFCDENGKAVKCYPSGIFFDELTQSLLVCGNNQLWRVSLNGRATVVCTLQQPSQVAATSNGTILVTSYNKNVIYKVIKQETGKYVVQTLGSGNRETKDGTSEECAFNGPFGITVDETEHCCYVADGAGNTIRKISFL